MVQLFGHNDRGGVAMSDFFMNDRYRVLECMAQRQIIVNNEAVVKLSQQEIADTLGFTKSKVNSIIRELIQKGYVTQVNALSLIHISEPTRPY